MVDMSNLSVLITGASQGIGKQIALKYAQKGATVSINYPFESEKENAQKVATEVEKLGGKGHIYEADVSDFSQVKKMTDDIISDIGKIDVLIANAGITKDKLIIRMSPEDWNSVINVNLTGSFNCTKAVTKHMMKSRWKNCIYFVCSWYNGKCWTSKLFSVQRWNYCSLQKCCKRIWSKEYYIKLYCTRIHRN